jgi:hypothetical protein
MLATYTWSKSLGNSHWRQIFSQHFNIGAQDAYNLSDMKSFNPFDQPHVFNLLWTYDLPFGKGKRYMGSANTLVNAVVGGWTISGAQRYYSGNLIQLVTPGNPLANTLFSTATKANLGSAPISTGVNRRDLDPNNPNVRWFNTGAFTAAAPFSFGTAALYQDDFRQPSIAFENIGIAKRTILFNNERTRSNCCTGRTRLTSSTGPASAASTVRWAMPTSDVPPGRRWVHARLRWDCV